jgi:hypothetical protein
MANLDRINLAIKVMERVGASENHRFNMAWWQSHRGQGIQVTEERAVSCWMAVAPEVRAIKKTGIDLCGALMYNGETAAHGMAKFLGITKKEASELVAPAMFPCDANKIKPADIICRLEKLKEKYGG